MMEFLNALFGGAIEVTFAILFVALFVFEIITSMKREERLSKRIDEQNKVLHQLILEIRKAEYYEAFKK